jgi:hypothetical protein
MLKKAFISVFLLTAVFELVAQPSTNQIRIDRGELRNVTGKKNPELLFDGSIATGNKMDQEESQNNAYATPMVFWLALDSAYEDLKLDYWHGFGASSWSVTFYDSTLTQSRAYSFSGVFSSLATMPGQPDTISFLTRFVRISTSDPSSDVRELYLYGDPVVKCLPIRATPAAAPTDPGKYFWGFGDTYPNLQYNDAGWSIRWQQDMFYIDTCTVCAPDNHNYVFSKFQNDLTTVFTPEIAAGRILSPYLAGPSRAFMFVVSDNNSKDIPHGADSTLASSWINTYRMANAYVTAFDLEEIEIGNEDDATWVDVKRYHRPEAKQQKLRQGYYGAKAAKPTVRVINGAMIRLDTTYLTGMQFLSYLTYGSMDSVFYDVANFNHYSTTSGGQGGSNTDGVSPEQDRIYDKLTAVRNWRDYWQPGKRVYWSEFGYDSLNSNYNVPDISGVANRGITKANWVLRSWLLAAAARVDRAYQYTARDQGGGDFGTTGFEQVIESPPTVFSTVPNRLYYWMTCLSIRIQNFKAWPTVVANGDSTGVWCLEFEHTTDTDSLFFSLHKGTHSNSTTSDYVLNIPGVQTAVLVTPASGDKDGTTTTLTPGPGTVTIPSVTETPQFLLVTVSEAVPASNRRNYFRGNLRNKFKNN